VPNEETSAAGNLIAAIFTAIFCTTFMYSVLKNKGRSKQTLKGYRFYSFTYLGLPFLSSMLWLFYAPALTHGIPSPITSAVGLTEQRTVTVLKSVVWGKNDNRYMLWLSGFTEGVPASKHTYNEFPPNTKAKVTIKTSILGSKILDYAHVEI